jgi:hypothetical protein
MKPFPALIAARKRHTCAMHRACPGRVEIEGVPYAAAVAVQPGALQNEDGGQRSAEILRVAISKSVLATPPARRDVLVYAGQNWVIEEVAGAEAWSQEWGITAYQ